MNITNLSTVELYEEWFNSQPEMRMKTSFVAFHGQSPTYSSMVYMVLEPNGFVGAHTDNVEEVVVVLEGTFTLIVNQEIQHVRANDIVLIPAMTTHEMVNNGDTRARAIGFFASPSVVTTFREPLMPDGKNMFGTPEVK
jgi:quercetin dioxygenase-like cupin family protein